MAETWEWEAEIESLPAMACSFARGNQEGQIQRDALRDADRMFYVKYLAAFCLQIVYMYLLIWRQ